MFLKQAAIRKSSRWVLATLLFGTILLSPACIATSEENEVVQDSITIGQLPYCDEDNVPKSESSKRLLYVSTLDGKISALDITKNGEVKWSVDTGDALLSSSIHKLELSTNGKWVRMIPSLSGGLYKFDGETIEAIPIKAEDLLKSSFKFSEDIVISGGIEKNSYGVSTKTGEILYQCSMRGCTNFTAADDKANKNGLHNALIDDVMIVRRETQTVRAVDPRSGQERWNFSIGQHELELMRSKDCQGGEKNDELDSLLLDLEIRAVIPEGIICAFSKKDPSSMLWMKRFSYPIVSAWKPDATYNIEHIDFFSSADWLWNGQSGLFSQTKPDTEQVSPSIYLGMYEKQPYIQESNSILQISQDKEYKGGKDLMTDDHSDFKFRVPFRPFPANKNGIELIEDHSTNADTTDTEVSITTESPLDVPTNAVATSVLYASEYANGNGFYFYTTRDSNKTQNNMCSNNKTKTGRPIVTTEDIDMNVMHRFYSLTFYWNEVVIIIVATAVFVYFLIKQHRPSEREYVVVEKHIPVPFAREAIEGIDYSKSRSSQRSTSESNQSDGSFQSRFATDFDVVQILGKGGFGVVFAVKNKIDDCHYAIKRIVLPSKKESRDRVMREVRTLANCEHQNIVRYFHAWIETPPPGWQEQQDCLMREREILSTSIDICETPTDVSSLPVFPPKKAIEDKKIGQDNWLMNLNKNPFGIDGISSIGGVPNGFTTTENNNDDEEEIETDDETSGGIVFQANSVSSVNNDPEEPIEEAIEDSFVVFEDEIDDKVNNKNDEVVVPICSDGNQTDSQTFSISSDNRKIVPYNKKSRRRRHLSLDLTSTGNVSLPPIQSSRIFLYIQMQLCQKNSLKEWLSKTSYLERKDKVVPIFEQILGAVEYVHLKGLIHRDLKPSNIFFALDGQIKIGDFGLVTDMSEQTTTPDEQTFLSSSSHSNSLKHTQRVGTTLYMSPEQIAGLPYNYKVDIFSLGLILFELFATFSTEMERINTLKDVRNHTFPGDFKNNFNNEYELLKLMLSENPSDRPTTIGIRARPPLQHQVSGGDEHHFELPPRQRRESYNNSNHNNSTFQMTDSFVKG